MSVELNYEDIEDAAQKLADGRGSITDILNELKSLVGELTESGFKTEQASPAFNENYENLTQELDQALDAIDAMSESLIQIRNAFEETDTAAAG